jgi:hypothetical protein
MGKSRTEDSSGYYIFSSKRSITLINHEEELNAIIVNEH